MSNESVRICNVTYARLFEKKGSTQKKARWPHRDGLQKPGICMHVDVSSRMHQLLVSQSFLIYAGWKSTISHRHQQYLFHSNMLIIEYLLFVSLYPPSVLCAQNDVKSVQETLTHTCRPISISGREKNKRKAARKRCLAVVRSGNESSSHVG